MRVRTVSLNPPHGSPARQALVTIGMTWVIVALTVTMPRPARCGANQNAKVAVHVLPHDGGRTCAQGMPEILGCADISTTLAGCGDIDFFPVFFEVAEYQGVEYGMTWPGSYSCAFTSCSDLTIGDIVRPGDGTSHAWTGCQPGPIAIPGWGWTTVQDSGEVRLTPHPTTGEITIGDCAGILDDIEHVSCAGVCGTYGDDPCGSGYNPLNLAKSDGLDGECTAPGQDLTYTIRYDSPNFNLVHDVTLVDYLPPEVEFVSATGGGTYDVGPHTVTWAIGTLGQYDSDSVQVTAHVLPETPYGTLLNNGAHIACLETGPTEVEILTTVCAGGFQPLWIEKTDGLGGNCTVPGAGITYSITCANQGNPASVHNVVMTDFLPEEVEFIAAADSGLYDPEQHSITWEVGTLASEASGMVEAQVAVATATDPGALLINRCRAVCSEAPVAERAETTQVCPSVFGPLGLEKRGTGSHSRPVFPGDDITYTLTYRNGANPYAVHGAVLRDSLPTQTTYVSAGGGGVYDDQSHTVTWDIGTLASNEGGSRQVVVNVPLETEPGTVITNLCEIVSDEAPGSEATARKTVIGFGECMMAVHVLPHQPTMTCAQAAPDVDGCDDVATTTGACDVDVFPVFFEILECQGVAYGLNWPIEWGEMFFTSCSDVTVGEIALPGDGISHLWTGCRTDYLILPGYGRLIADTPGLIELIPHPTTGVISLTTCGGYEYEVLPMGLAFRAGVCGAEGDRIDCGGPQQTRPTTWSGIKAMFR
jgi:uncharacterized repeat protein (TIGR01451 family)